jgi:all-trans-retinol 13,14-reductase
MENGDVIHADEIVSSVGVRNTFKRLLTKDLHICCGSFHGPLIDFPSEYLPKNIDVYRKLMDNIKPSVQHMYCFIKLRGDPASLGLRSSNLWIYPHSDYDKVEREFLEEPLEAPMPMFMGFSCAKDPDWNDNYPGVSNAIILTVAKKEWFNEWEDKRCGKRGDVYNDYKNKIGERMLEEGLYKFFPKTRGCVEHSEMGTPLTTQFYLGAGDGESYGLDINKYRLLDGIGLRPKTSIDGLYLTGQDICTLGVAGALNAGVMTASVIMGYDNLVDIGLGNNIITDLQEKAVWDEKEIRKRRKNERANK